MLSLVRVAWVQALKETFGEDLCSQPACRQRQRPIPSMMIIVKLCTGRFCRGRQCWLCLQTFKRLMLRAALRQVFCSRPGRGSSTRIWMTYSAVGIRNSGRNHKRRSQSARRLDPRLFGARQGAPFGPGKRSLDWPFGEICGRAAVDPAGPGALSKRARSARKERSMVPQSPRPTAAHRGPRL
jgi:hypothetical protein